MSDVKFGAPLRISKITLELSLNLQRGEEGELKVTTESNPPVDEGLDWTVVFERFDTPEQPLPSGFYNFTYSESGGLSIEDLPLELGEERREQVRMQFRAFMRMHFNKLVSMMIHFPDHEDLMDLVEHLARLAVSHHIESAMVGDGNIDEGMRLSVEAEFDGERFGTILHKSKECDHVGMLRLRSTPYLFALRRREDGSSAIQVTIQTKSIHREWVASHLVRQIETLVTEQLPILLEIELGEIEKNQGLIDQILSVLRGQSKHR